MISERLKVARLRAGLSQEKLGKLAGIDPTSASARMNQYERGKHAPDYRLMCKVAEILKMPVSWFYTQDDDMARLQEVFFTPRCVGSRRSGWAKSSRRNRLDAFCV